MMLSMRLAVISLFWLVGGQAGKLHTVFEWKRMDFKYDSARKAAHLASGFYNPDVPVPIDVDAYYNWNGSHRIFLSIPRFSIGSPVTLVELIQRRNAEPVLVPFPPIEWQDDVQKCKKDRLISVFRTKIDECDRLWILDSGSYNDELICPPQLIAFHLKTNKMEVRFEFPKKLYSSDSAFVTPTVEIRDGKCDDAYVYMADTGAFTLAVYSMKSGKSWLTKDHTMDADPKSTTFSVQGDSFELADGILGLDIQPSGKGNLKVFYSALSGRTMNSVDASTLRDGNLFENNPSSSPQLFRQFPTKRPSQSAAFAIDKRGIAYFGLMTETSINCWNTRSSDYGQYISTVYQNNRTMQFASGVKVADRGKGGEELWVLTSRFQKLMNGNYNFNEVNFRISVGSIPNVIMGTKCKYPNNK